MKTASREDENSGGGGTSGGHTRLIGRIIKTRKTQQESA